MRARERERDSKRETERERAISIQHVHIQYIQYIFNVYACVLRVLPALMHASINLVQEVPHLIELFLSLSHTLSHSRSGSLACTLFCSLSLFQSSACSLALLLSRSLALSLSRSLALSLSRSSRTLSGSRSRCRFRTLSPFPFPSLSPSLSLSLIYPSWQSQLRFQATKEDVVADFAPPYMYMCIRTCTYTNKDISLQLGCTYAYCMWQYGGCGVADKAATAHMSVHTCMHACMHACM